jgi:transcription antitermination factor NusA-like protein
MHIESNRVKQNKVGGLRGRKGERIRTINKRLDKWVREKKKTRKR